MLYFDENEQYDQDYPQFGLSNLLEKGYEDFDFSNEIVTFSQEMNYKELYDNENGNEEEKLFELKCNYEKKNLTELRTDAKTGPETRNVKDKNGLIFKISKEMKNNVVGHKRKEKKHDKFSYDNLTRKVKSKLFDSISSFLNSSLEKVQKENPKKYSKKILYSKPFFLKIDQQIIKDINVETNQKLLKSQLKEIFSNNVSKKCENYGLDYNKKLVEKIYEEKIQTKTMAILERTLLECLEQFRGTKQYKDLEGLEKEYANVIKSLIENNETEEYINIFKDLVNRFEKYYENKKARPKRKE